MSEKADNTEETEAATEGIAGRIHREQIYEPSEEDDVSATLNRAIRLLDEAEWELERLGYDDEHRVARMLRHDLRIMRILIEERGKGNSDFFNYEVEADRFRKLAERAPGGSYTE